MKKNQELIDVFEDTQKLADEVIEAWPREVASYLFDPSHREFKNKIFVIPTDTISAAIRFTSTQDPETNVTVLNMASYKRAGGGVRNGAKSQEEDLFRCTNLCNLVPQHLYPLKEDQMIVTHEAVILKDAKYQPLPRKRKISVITAPALNLNKNSFYDSAKGGWIDQIEDKPEDYERITKRRIRNIILEAVRINTRYLLLGAWGCGVFKNKPEDMARMFYEVLVEEGLYQLFKGGVIFPIINDRNSRGNNYDVFWQQFS